MTIIEFTALLLSQPFSLSPSLMIKCACACNIGLSVGCMFCLNRTITLLQHNMNIWSIDFDWSSNPKRNPLLELWFLIKFTVCVRQNMQIICKQSLTKSTTLCLCRRSTLFIFENRNKHKKTCLFSSFVGSLRFIYSFEFWLTISEFYLLSTLSASLLRVYVELATNQSNTLANKMYVKKDMNE